MEAHLLIKAAVVLITLPYQMSYKNEKTNNRSKNSFLYQAVNMLCNVGLYGQ